MFIAELKNNCASCQNAALNAVAGFTGFVLDPNHPYTTYGLAETLASLGIYPIISPSLPGESEIMLHLCDVERRRRMLPTEGATPYVDAELLQLLEVWIKALPISENSS